VAHRVAHLGALGRQFAAPRHPRNPLIARISQPV
jgi:hypothetical protein